VQSFGGQTSPGLTRSLEAGSKESLVKAEKSNKGKEEETMKHYFAPRGNGIT